MQQRVLLLLGVVVLATATATATATTTATTTATATATATTTRVCERRCAPMRHGCCDVDASGYCRDPPGASVCPSCDCDAGRAQWRCLPNGTRVPPHAEWDECVSLFTVSPHASSTHGELDACEFCGADPLEHHRRPSLLSSSSSSSSSSSAAAAAAASADGVFEKRQAIDEIDVHFDDTPYNFTLTGYRGLNWEHRWNGLGYRRREGYWSTPKDNRTAAWNHSPPNHVVNHWGATRMAIEFPGTVQVRGAYFSVEGSEFNWASAVKAEAYLFGRLVDETPWMPLFTNTTGKWLTMDFINVDLVLIESAAAREGGGWYSMDNLQYRGPNWAPDETTTGVTGVSIPVSTGLGGIGPVPSTGFPPTGGVVPTPEPTVPVTPPPPDRCPETLLPFNRSMVLVTRNCENNVVQCTILVAWSYDDANSYQFEAQFRLMGVPGVTPEWKDFYTGLERTGLLEFVQRDATYEFRVYARAFCDNGDVVSSPPSPVLVVGPELDGFLN